MDDGKAMDIVGESGGDGRRELGKEGDSPPVPRSRRRRCATPNQVRLALLTVLKKLDGGQIDAQHANASANVLRLVLQCVTEGDVEIRVRRIERAFEHAISAARVPDA